MRILKNYRRKLENRILTNSEKYYLEISELPLYNWEKITQGNHRFVNKDGKSTKYDGYIFVKLYNEYLEKYGLEGGLDKFLSLKQKLTKLKCLYIETSDRIYLTEIDICEADVEKADPSNHDGMSLDACLIQLSKFMGYSVDKRMISIVQFKEMMSSYVEANK